MPPSVQLLSAMLGYIDTLVTRRRFIPVWTVACPYPSRFMPTAYFGLRKRMSHKTKASSNGAVACISPSIMYALMDAKKGNIMLAPGSCKVGNMVP